MSGKARLDCNGIYNLNVTNRVGLAANVTQGPDGGIKLDDGLSYSFMKDNNVSPWLFRASATSRTLK